MFIAATAIVDPSAKIGENTKVWHFCQIRESVRIGTNCILSKGVYVDARVNIGNNVKIQNHASIFEGVTIEDGVFIGPHVCFTNDLSPRAVNPDLSQKLSSDWHISKTQVGEGASLGANSTIVCGVTIGRWAMVGAGAVITHSVPDYALVYGNPAHIRGVVAPDGQILSRSYQSGEYAWSGGVITIAL